MMLNRPELTVRGVLMDIGLIIGAAIILTAGVLILKGAPKKNDIPVKQMELTQEELDQGYVTYTMVQDDWQGKVLWVDARSRREWMHDGAEASVLLNGDSKESWDELMAEAFPKLASAAEQGKKVVVYCAQTGCEDSYFVAQALRREGLVEHVYILKGGVPNSK